MAEKLEIDLSEDFFYLGSLVKDTMQSNVLLGESVEGSKDEESTSYLRNCTGR